MTLPQFDHLIAEKTGEHIVTLTINRPDKRNALNAKLLAELHEALIAVEQSDEIRVLLITGSGDKAFVAGADIRELSKLNRKTGEELSTRGQEVFQLIGNSSKVVIAAINGYALGGGAELAMACHIRYADESALIGLPEVTLGLIPGYGGTQRLPQLVGLSKAMEMILTGKPVSAQQAKQIGLVNEVYSKEKLMDAAIKTATVIANNGPVAVKKALDALRAATPLHGLAEEARLFGELCETADFKEGTEAFLEKRKPDFRNR